MTFTWISNSNYDIFEKLLGVPDYLIETPLAYENILIKFIYTKSNFCL